MSSWKRPGYRVRKPWNTAQLLPFQVVLGASEWYTIRRPSSPNREFVFGEDLGGALHVHRDITQRIRDIDLFKRYVVARRANKQLFVGLDEKTELPVFVERGETYQPLMYQRNKDYFKDFFGNANGQYDIVISFATAKEAVTFRMMMSGVHE